jgi:hypothetical protein
LSTGIEKNLEERGVVIRISRIRGGRHFLDILKTRIPPPLYGIGTATLMWWVDRVLPIMRVIDAPWNRLR